MQICKPVLNAVAQAGAYTSCQKGYRNMSENGGERGIRTLDTVSRIHAFQACAFNHSATSPHWNERNIHKIIQRSSIVTGSHKDDHSWIAGAACPRQAAGCAGVVEDQAHALLKVTDMRDWSLSPAMPT